MNEMTRDLWTIVHHVRPTVTVLDEFSKWVWLTDQSEVIFKTCLRELVRECFKVKSVVINRFGIGSSSPWILFGMNGTSRSSTLYFDPFIRNPQTSVTYVSQQWFVDTCLYTFQDWNCTLIQTIVKTETRHSSLVKCFSYVLAVDLVYNRQEEFLQQPIFQQDRLSFHESVSLLFGDNPGYLFEFRVKSKFNGLE